MALGTSVYGFETTRALLYWSANAVALFLGAQLLEVHRVRRKILTGLAYFTGAIAVVGILQYFTSPTLVYWIFRLHMEKRSDRSCTAISSRRWWNWCCRSYSTG